MTPKSLRYREATGAEGHAQPGSHGRVLANLKGITSKLTMDLLEYQALLAAQERYYTTLTARRRFTSALLCQMHGDWLGALYAWAGKYRTVELQKGNFVWPPAYLVAENMGRFEGGLLRSLTPCRAGPLDSVTDALARKPCRAVTHPSLSRRQRPPGSMVGGHDGSAGGVPCPELWARRPRQPCAAGVLPRRGIPGLRPELRAAGRLLRGGHPPGGRLRPRSPSFGRFWPWQAAGPFEN